METNYFALYKGKIVYVPDVPEKPDPNANAWKFHDITVYSYALADGHYQKALQSAIANGIEVENQDEVKNVLMKNGGNEIDLHPSTIYPLQCRVEIIHLYPTLDDDVLIKEMARVTFEQPENGDFYKERVKYYDGVIESLKSRLAELEQPEKKDDVAPTQVETYAGTLHIGGDALGWQRELDKWIDNEKRGIPPISGREKAWRLRRSGVIEPEAAGQEQEEVVYGIHTGCMYEGGGTKRRLFSSIDDAREECLRLVKKNQEEIVKMYADDPEDLNSYTWRQIDEDSWNNSVDEIMIVEFTITRKP